MSAPTALVEQELTLNTSTLGLGTHTLFIRVQDDAGTWSMVAHGDFENTNKENQTITFTDFTTAIYGDAIALDASASSQLDVTYESSNEDIAEVVDSELIMKGVGNATLTIAQAGNDDFVAVAKVIEFEAGKAAITALAMDQSTTYGGQADAFAIEYDGFVLEDDESVLDTPPVASSEATVTSNVGMYDILLSEGLDDHYEITETNGELTIDKAPLKVIADDAAITYGYAEPAYSFSYSGFVNGEDASVINTAPSSVSTTLPLTDAGSYGLEIAEDGEDDNYTLAYVPGVLTVDKAPLTATVADATKVYGDANPRIVVAYEGFVLDEDESDLDQEPVIGSGISELTGVGSYPLIADFSSLTNYSVTATQGVLTVTQAALTATANDQSKVYGEDNPSFDMAYSGFVNGDVADDLDTPPVATTVATSGSDVGSYDIVLTGGYDLNYAIAGMPGVLSVNQAPLTATANDQSKVYGEDNPLFDFVYSGFVSADDASVIDTDPTASTLATPASDIGTYDISLEGGIDNNYFFQYADGALSVGKASLEVTAEDLSMAAGDEVPTLS